MRFSSRAAAVAATATVVVVSASLAGCSSTAVTPATSAVAVPSTTPGGTALLVQVTDGTNSRSFTVTCDPPGGTHPNPQSACDFLDLAKKWGQDPFVPVGQDQVCAQDYGGPLTATVTGTWNGKTIDAKFARNNSCEIQRWENAVALLAVEESAKGAAPSPTSAPSGSYRTR